MKIVVIEPAGKGGMIHYAYQLCRAMAASGADVTLVTSRDYELEHLEQPFEVDRFIELWDAKPAGQLSTGWWATAWRKVRRIGRAVRYYAEWLRLVRHVGRLRPDVVQMGDIRFPFDLFPLLLLRRKAPLFVDICHNVHPFSAGGSSGGLFDRSKSRRRFYKRIYGLFDLVFVHFERNRDEFVRTFAVDPRKVGVIVHGNEEIFRELRAADVDGAALRRGHGIPADRRVILFFGTLSRYKGTDVLLEAFAEVHRQTGAMLVLAGYPFHDFDLAQHRQIATDSGVGDAVVWVPEYVPSDEVAGWMELADVIVFPYRDIYQSGAIHVAQTFGVPTVATAVGALQDVVQDGVSGLLVPPEDATALASAITRLLEDRSLADRVGTAAAADARGRYSWQANARVILDRYRSR